MFEEAQSSMSRAGQIIAGFKATGGSGRKTAIKSDRLENFWMHNNFSLDKKFIIVPLESLSDVTCRR